MPFHRGVDPPHNLASDDSGEGNSVGSARQFVDAVAKIVVDVVDAHLVLGVALAGFPLQFDERVQPEFLQAADGFDRLPGNRRLAQRRLIRARDVDALLVDAGFAFRAVDAFLRFFVAELDDLDALHVPAHRVQMLNGIEIAIEAAFAVGVGTDVVVLRSGIAADRFVLREHAGGRFFRGDCRT